MDRQTDRQRNHVGDSSTYSCLDARTNLSAVISHTWERKTKWERKEMKKKTCLGVSYNSFPYIGTHAQFFP